MSPLLDPIPHILRVNSLNLLAGASGIGKTAFLSDIIRRIELGRPVFGHHVSPPPAIGYFAADRSWRENQHWFTTAGVESVTTLSLVDAADITLPNQRMKHLRVQFFKECVSRMNLPPGALLIVDPIALFLGGNLLDYDTCAFACIEIQRWLNDPSRQYCIIGVCHSSKQKGNTDDRYVRLQDRISGSMAQLGFTSTQMYLAGPTETNDKDGRFTFLWNPHTAPGETFQFSRGDNGLFLLEEASRLSDAPTETLDPDALSSFEVEVLAQFPLDGTPVATAQFNALYSDLGETGRKRITRALQGLESRKVIRQLRRGFWARKPVDPNAP